MSVLLRVLIIEDSEDDLALIVRELRQSGFSPHFERVDTEASLLAALENQTWDVVIADYVLPRFSGLAALQIVRASQVDLPFIVVSGRIGEEIAVETMRAGANDYVLKDSLKRLGAAVEREVREAAMRQEHRRVEASLAWLTRQHELILNSAGEGIYGLDTQGKTVFVNPAAVKMLGWEVEELLGQPMHELLHYIKPDGTAYPVEQCPIIATLKDGQVYRRSDEVFWRKDGSSFPVEYISTPLVREDDPSDDPSIEGVVITFQDISGRLKTEEALRKNQEQLRQSQKMEAVGRLAGGIAHDFNNLLTAIFGYCDLLVSFKDNPAEVETNVSEIKQAATRASQLTRQLLSFSYKQVIQPRTLNMGTLINQMTSMIRRLIRENIELIIDIDPDLNSIRADPGQIEQLILNLAVNARDSMPNGGSLTIELSNASLVEEYLHPQVSIAPGSYVVLTVSDTGSGMDKQILSHIFEPFFTTKERGQGTGLGLATVYAIVQQSGGYIWVESELDSGSTFKIYLPSILSEAAVQDSSPFSNSRANSLPTGSETILIAEDEKVVRDLILRTLKKSGYKVLTASNGEEALQIFEAQGHLIDLLLTDVIMPKMGGPELARKLKTTRPELCVVYMSGYTDKAFEQSELTLPNVNFIQKPFTPQALVQEVRKMLDKRQARP